MGRWCFGITAFFCPAAFTYTAADEADEDGTSRGARLIQFETRVNDKQRFFALEIGDRRRISFLVAGISVVHIIQFAIAPPGTALSRGSGIALNALAVFWSVRPHRAPGFWFGLLPYIWCIAAIFDGMALFRALQDGRAETSVALLAGVNVLLLPFLALPLVRFYKASKDTSEAR